MKNLLLLISLILLSFTISNTGELRGTITENETGEGVPFATISLVINGTTVGAQSDFDGFYSIKPIPPGTYDIVVSSLGYQTNKTTGIIISSNKTTTHNVKLGTESELLDEVVIVEYKIPLISDDMTSTGVTVTKNEIRSMPRRNTRSIKSSVAGVSGKKNRKKVKVKGARANSTNYHVDGVAVPDKGEMFMARGNVADFNTEDYAETKENEFLSSKDNPLSTFSIDVDAASYTNMRRMIRDGQKPMKYHVRIEEMINYFKYDYPQPEGDEPFNVITELSECPWNSDHKLFHIGLQGKKVEDEALPGSNLVFLIDVSGSMSSSNKLPLLIESFKLLTDKLREKDKVAIVVYAGSSGLVLPSTSGADKHKIKSALSKLRSGGSTAGAAGIELAYKVALDNFIEGGNNRVVLATDGDFNVGISSDGGLVDLIEKKRENGVFLSVLGFGMGNYKDNKMQQLSNKGNGNHYYIDGIREAKKVLVNEFGGTLFTIAKDVKLQLEFNPKKVKGYRLIGYENRMLAKEDFNNDKKDAGELGSGHTVTALYEIIPAGSKETVLNDVDELKYQKKVKNLKKYNDELLTIKLRYKKPDENISKLSSIAVSDKLESFENTSDNFKFAASVAEFGLLLRESKFKEKANYKEVLKIATQSKGQDQYGYRNEFIGLVKRVSKM